jgi:hypothetical protein
MRNHGNLSRRDLTKLAAGASTGVALGAPTPLFNRRTLDGWLQIENSATSFSTVDLNAAPGFLAKIASGEDRVSAFLRQFGAGFVKSLEDLYRNQGLFPAFDLKNEVSDAWYTANHPAAGATERVMTIDKLNEKLPIFTKGHALAKIRATDIYLFASSSLSSAAFTISQNGNDISFADGPLLDATTTMKSFVASGVDAAMNSLQLKITDTNTPIEKIWLVQRYTLQ